MIRLPAKSKEEIIVTKRGNQIKSKRKAFSAIAIPFRKDLKTFNRLPAKSRKSILLSFNTSYFLSCPIFDFAGSLIKEIECST